VLNSESLFILSDIRFFPRSFTFFNPPLSLFGFHPPIQGHLLIRFTTLYLTPYFMACCPLFLLRIIHWITVSCFEMVYSGLFFIV